MAHTHLLYTTNVYCYQKISKLDFKDKMLNVHASDNQKKFAKTFPHGFIAFLPLPTRTIYHVVNKYYKEIRNAGLTHSRNT